MSDLIQLGARRPGPPKPEEVSLIFSKEGEAELEALKTHYPNLKACILPALWIAQREYGGELSGAALAEVAIRLNRSYAEIEGVATFYTMYNTGHKPGLHKIEVCTCIACQVCGAYPLFQHLKSKLGIDNMETTEDGLFTIEEVECLDACDRAPVVQVGDEYYGPLDEKGLDELLEKLRNTKESTVLRLADQIVKCQVAADDKKS